MEFPGELLFVGAFFLFLFLILGAWCGVVVFFFVCIYIVWYDDMLCRTVSVWFLDCGVGGSPWWWWWWW